MKWKCSLTCTYTHIHIHVHIHVCTYMYIRCYNMARLRKGNYMCRVQLQGPPPSPSPPPSSPSPPPSSPHSPPHRRRGRSALSPRTGRGRGVWRCGCSTSVASDNASPQSPPHSDLAVRICTHLSIHAVAMHTIITG